MIVRGGRPISVNSDLQWSADDRRVKQGWYVFTLSTGARDCILTLDADHESKNPHVEAIDWSPAGDVLYVSYGESDRWDRGVMRLQLSDRQLLPLVKDSRLYPSSSSRATAGRSCSRCPTATPRLMSMRRTPTSRLCGS